MHTVYRCLMACRISYRSADGRTILQLEFEPHDAYFIVLKGKTSIPEMSFAKKERRTLCQVDGNWDIIFEDRFGDRKKNKYKRLDLVD